MKVWIVGRKTADDGKDGGAWELMAVCSTQERALQAVRCNLDFIGPAVLDEILPEETEPWFGCYYPKLETPEQAAARHNVPLDEWMDSS